MRSHQNQEIFCQKLGLSSTECVLFQDIWQKGNTAFKGDGGQQI